MEMEFRDHSRRRKLGMVLGVGLAVGAGGLAFYFGSQGTTTAEPALTRSVVAAVVDIPARSVLESSLLTIRDVPDDPSVVNAITDPASVLGLITGVRIYAGQVLTPNLLATGSASEAFSIVSPAETIGPDSPNWRAASIRVDKERAVAAKSCPANTSTSSRRCR